MDYRTKFILLVLFEIPAILISIVILAHFAQNRQASVKLKNHGWVILLLVNLVQLLVDSPMPMSFYYQSFVWPATNSYCLWWTWCEFSLNSIGLFLMAWISIERHLIVFHSHTAFRSRWKKCLDHFLPIVFCLLWSPIFFLVVVVISPTCRNEWSFETLGCGPPCYYGISILSQFDFLFNLLLPCLLIFFASLTLVIRVIHQKLARQQVVHWRRHRKLVLQLWAVSSLYLAIWSPVSLTILIQLTIDPSFMSDYLETMQFITFFTPMLLPVICLSTLPELTKKIIRYITGSPTNVIGIVSYSRNVRPTLRIDPAR